MWLEVPLNFLVKLPATPDLHLFLGGGPYAAFGISGKVKASSGTVSVDEDLKFGNDAGDDLKGTDFGFNLLGGVQLNSGLNLGIGYGIGLTKLNPSAATSNISNRVLSFSLGFRF